ncbi:MAG: metallophosphoesterase [Bacteroidetes bacterium HGW-Bacteroidetes-10]|nr:MAG: metallophosphoesterase [Bacteroidetes bacterium HGW-Bacteroidetes-10]
MKKLNFVAAVLFVSLLSSCTKVDEMKLIDPFSGGSKERNLIVVISDIHLGADLSYAECSKNLRSLELFLSEVKSSRHVKELVIAGDMLDEWFIPATVDIYQGKDQADYVNRIASANRGVINAFNRIIKEGKILVTYVPGNHDLTITAENVDRILPGINQARDEEQGLGTYYPQGFPQIAIEHAHRYNFFCAPDPISNQDIAPGTITPPGYFFTRIGVHSYINNFPPAVDVIPEVTPNILGNPSQLMLFLYWNVWSRTLERFTIPNKFDEKIIVTNMDGFRGAYSVNDVLPYQSIRGGHIDVKLYKGIQDTWDQRQVHNKVAVGIPVSQAIANAAKAGESDFQARNQYFLNPQSEARVVIFGHTHDPKIIASNNHKGQKSIYANSGTWIDHNSVVPATMSFVVIAPQSEKENSYTHVRLYNFEKEIVTLMARDSLRF